MCGLMPMAERRPFHNEAASPGLHPLLSRRVKGAMGLASNILRNWRVRRMRRAIARRLDRNPVAVAQMQLLFRMMLTDGVIHDDELKAFHAICVKHFDIAPEEIVGLHSYLERRQARWSADDRERLLAGMDRPARLRLIGFMGEIAESEEAHARAKSNPDESRRFIREAAVVLGVADAAKTP